MMTMSCNRRLFLIINSNGYNTRAYWANISTYFDIPCLYAVNTRIIIKMVFG